MTATRRARSTARPIFRAAGILAVAAVAVALLASPASAAVPELLWQVPENGLSGDGAGQLEGPYGIAADPDSGHVYVTDYGNSRIDEFDAWGEFVKAWGWGVRNGADEAQTCGPGATPPSTTCLKGIEGSGPGQFGHPSGGIALDSDGDIYVGDMERNHRVQKFDPEGDFLLMFGGDVNKGPNHPGDVCTAANLLEGDTCGAGVNGKGDGEFWFGVGGNHIAVGPAGTIFVGDSQSRIQEFEANGAFKSKIVPEGELGGEGRGANSLVVDGSGNFYATQSIGSEGSNPQSLPQPDTHHVYKFSPAGALISTIAVELQGESPLALDAAGHLYVVASQPGHDEVAERREIIEFGPGGAPIIPAGSGFAIAGGGYYLDKPELFTGLAANTVTADGRADVYAATTGASGAPTSSVASYGPPPDKWLPPVKPPEITSQYAVSVDTDGALLRAQINPRFWKDTAYYVEYGVGKCLEGGCAAQQPAAPGTELGAGIVGNSARTKGVLLAGLSPQTTYHYRFVAQSGGGGPVRGVGGKVGVDGAEGTFTTPALPQPPNPGCANQEFRGGASAFLPDCRAYEMVSPVDKNGADVIGLCNINCARAEINQSSIEGDKLTYSSNKAFGDSQAGRYASQYVATRGPDGWATHGISPPFSAGLFDGVTTKVTEPEFRAFSADLSSAWLIDASRFKLTPDAVSGFVNLYRQDTGDGSLSALTTSEPPFTKSVNYNLEFQGHTPDGSHVIFTANAPLTPDAVAGVNTQLYEYSGGETRLVSLLPDGGAFPGDSSAGTNAAKSSIHGGAALSHAISDDGSRVFWSAGGNGGAGKIYARLNADQAQSALSAGGKCTQPAKACTYAVSAGTAQFWGADPSGSEALFSEGTTADLYTFDTGAKAKTLVAHKVFGVLGASEDLSRIYFASKEALAPGAVAGERNLYLDDEGAMTFVATLAATDTGAVSTEPSDLHPSPVMHNTRISADGLHVAFMSTNSLTGYDNADAVNGKAAAEVYVYDAEAQQLTCVSCNPSGARPQGDALKFPYSLPGRGGYETGLWTAAWLNTSENSLYEPRALSTDGSRLFFNSFDALAPRDTNGAQDVYQWEAPGSGDCTTGSASYSAPNGGCIGLISSGQSPEDSEFLDATPDGSEAFFKTQASLDPRDPGLIDIYVARVGGGYPPPPTPAAPCLGDACQSVPAAPNDPTPASAGFRGAGDPSPRKPLPRKSCRARKGKASKSKQAKRKQAKRCKRANRRAGR